MIKSIPSVLGQIFPAVFAGLIWGWQDKYPEIVWAAYIAFFVGVGVIGQWRYGMVFGDQIRLFAVDPIEALTRRGKSNEFFEAYLYGLISTFVLGLGGVYLALGEDLLIWGIILIMGAVLKLAYDASVHERHSDG